MVPGWSASGVVFQSKPNAARAVMVGGSIDQIVTRSLAKSP